MNLKKQLQSGEFVDIVGIRSAKGNRVCDQHPYGCGRQLLEAGYLVRFSHGVVEFEEEIVERDNQLLKKMTKNDLKGMCRRKGLVQNGNKTDLIERIIAYAREHEEDDDREVIIRRWEEPAIMVWSVETGCLLGYLPKWCHYLYEDGCFEDVRGVVVRMKEDSEFEAERAESQVQLFVK
jgi:hypothetical protein